MAFQLSPPIPDYAPQNQVQAVQGAITPITTAITNTATTPTQATGLTITLPTIAPTVKYFKVYVVADSASNTAAVNITLSLWLGTVGTGTQLASSTSTIAAGGKFDVDSIWLISAASYIGTTPTFNIGLHGSGAGTNTLNGSTTTPIFYWIEEL